MTKGQSVETISETILIFGEPLTSLLDADGSYGKPEFERCMGVVVNAWNAVTLDDVQNTDAWTTSLLEHAADGPPEMAAMPRLLVERKKAMFADGVRGVGEYWVRENGRELTFGCDARDVSGKYSTAK